MSLSKIYKLRRVIEEDSRPKHFQGKEFGGCTTSFDLAPSRSINLLGFTFFGHHCSVEGPANYYVTIRIEERVPDTPLSLAQVVWRTIVGGPPSNQMKQPVIYEETGSNVVGVTEKDFVVHLDEPVFVEEGQCVSIKFQIDGPPTEHLTETEVYRTMLFEEESAVVFDTLVGSSQLKEVIFNLA